MYLSNFSVSLVIVAASSMSFEVEAMVDNGLEVLEMDDALLGSGMVAAPKLRLC